MSHKLESLLDLLRRGERKVDAQVIDLLMGCNDRIGALVNELDQYQAERSSIDDLTARLEGSATQASAEEPGGAGGQADEAGYIDDEYDEELFGIFVEQLKEGVSGLEQDTAQMARGVGDVSLLETSADRLNTLRSSANYMGYDELKKIYGQWSEALDQALEQQKAGKETDFAVFSTETMQANIDKVKALFPKVEFPASPEPEIVEPAVVPDAEPETDTAGQAQDTDQGLLSDFIAETGEHLEETERNLLRLEQQPDDVEILNEVFRSIHTIKGSSEYLGMERIAELSHKLESLLDLLRRGERKVDAQVIDLLMGCNDRIGALVNELDQHQAERSPIDDLLERLTDTPKDAEARETEKETAEIAAVPDDDVKVVYGEEYDQELFTIFLNQLNTGLQLIAEAAESIRKGHETGPVLERCVEQVRTLRSSANYMEYEDLRKLYDNWLQQMLGIIAELQKGGEIDTEELARNVLLARVDRVRQFFQSQPEIEERLPDVQGGTDSVTDVSHDLAAAITEQFKDMGPDFKSVSMEDLIDDEQFAVLDDPVDSGEDAGLLDKLASAFDARLGDSIEKMEQPLPEDIENHLLSGDGPTKSTTPAIQPPPVMEKETFEPSGEEPVEMDIVETMLFSEARSESPHEQPTIEARMAPPEKSEIKAAAAPAPESPERRNRYNLGRRKSDKYHDRVQKQSLRVDAAKIDALMNQVGELVVSRSGFNQLFAEMRELQLILKQSQKLSAGEMQLIKEITNRINEATLSLGRVTTELQENVMKVRMLPIAQLFSRYPRLVHDLVRNMQKKVELEIYGEETELDKMVIEQLADPLIHIIRNAVDHGIEDQATRRQKGKAESGTLRLEAYHEGNYVVIEISDDGQGIDVALIKRQALKKGFATAEELEELNEQQIMALIMRPGFSTADEVTHTSGRGVGMDVVKDSIEKLNGTIDINSTLGSGVLFKIKIPLTLAIIPALLVRLNDEIFTIPLSTVEETIRVSKKEISTIEGVEVFSLRDNTIPLIRLSRIFNMGTAGGEPQELFVVIVNTGAKEVGFVVDELVARQEVVIKPLEDYLQEKSGFSGATILGDGSISLILDVFELVELSLDQHSSKTKAVVA